MRPLDSLGVDRGWRCLEVGAGGGSIAEWLCDRVASHEWWSRSIWTTVLRELSRPDLEVRSHDVLEDAPTGGGVRPHWRGGHAGGTVWRLTFNRLRDAMTASKLVTPADIDDAIALCADF